MLRAGMIGDPASMHTGSWLRDGVRDGQKADGLYECGLSWHIPSSFYVKVQGWIRCARQAMAVNLNQLKQYRHAVAGDKND